MEQRIKYSTCLIMKIKAYDTVELKSYLVLSGSSTLVTMGNIYLSWERIVVALHIS